MTARRVQRKPALPVRRNGVAVPADARTLLEWIDQGRLDRHDLSTEQRRACVVALRWMNKSQQAIADFFGVHRSTIRDDIKRVASELGAEARKLTPDEVLGQLLATAERVQIEAFKVKDPRLAWDVQKDMVRLLGEFGVLDRERREGYKLTIETVNDAGQRFARLLDDCLDPRLTGEVVDVAFNAGGGEGEDDSDEGPEG